MSIAISRPWARPSSTASLRAGGFFAVTNKARETDRLIAAASPAAVKVEIHGIKVAGASMSMQRLENGLGLPPDTAITLKPRGYHLLIELNAPIAQGQRIAVTLTFAKAGTRQIELPVEAAGPVGNDTLMEDQPG